MISPLKMVSKHRFLYWFSVLSLMCFSLITLSIVRLSAYSSTTGPDVWQKLNSSTPPLVIDTRAYTDYLEGHIPTAISLPYSEGVDEQLVTYITGLGYTEIITYCTCPQGSTAKAYAELLETNGLKLSLYYMVDNFNYWTYQIVTGSEPGTIETTLPSDENQASTPSPAPDLIFLLVNAVLLGIAGIIVWQKRK